MLNFVKGHLLAPSSPALLLAKSVKKTSCISFTELRGAPVSRSPWKLKACLLATSSNLLATAQIFRATNIPKNDSSCIQNRKRIHASRKVILVWITFHSKKKVTSLI